MGDFQQSKTMKKIVTSYQGFLSLIKKNMQNPSLMVRLKFKNVKVFQDAMVMWNMRKLYDIRWISNERKRMSIKCKREGNDCKIFALPM